jgi:hypothetical protein
MNSARVISCRTASQPPLQPGSDSQVVPWDKQFFDPIELQNGRKLVTLRDAALYITELPKAEHEAFEW